MSFFLSTFTMPNFGINPPEEALPSNKLPPKISFLQVEKSMRTATTALSI